MTETTNNLKRDTIEFEPSADSYDCGLMAATSGEHGVTFEITEDKAVGSYNEEFTCASCLSRSEATRLRDWLTEVLS